MLKDSRDSRTVILQLAKAGAGSFSGLVLMAASGKIIAVVAGPTGIGLLSLLRQLRQTAYSLSTVSGQTALVQGGARRVAEKRIRFLASVLVVFLAATLLVVFAMLLMAPVIAEYVLGERSPNNESLVRLCTLPVIVGSIQFFTNGLLMIHRAMGRLAVEQLCAGLALLAVSFPVAQSYADGNAVAFIAMMTVYPGVGLCVSIITGWRRAELRSTVGAVLRGWSNSEDIRCFFRIAGTMVVTAFVGTGSILVIRSLVAKSYGLAGAGIFDAGWTITVTSPIAVLAAFQGYYLPLLSGEPSLDVRRLMIRRFVALAIVGMTPVVVVGVIFKTLIISLLYSGQFADALPLLHWLLVGLYLRITAWVLTVPILADGNMAAWLKYEVGVNAGLLAVAMMVTLTGAPLERIGVGYFALFGAAVLYGLRYVVRTGQLRTSLREIGLWAAGLVIVGVTSFATRGGIRADWLPAAGCLFVAVVFSGYSGRRLSRSIHYPPPDARGVG